VVQVCADLVYMVVEGYRCFLAWCAWVWRWCTCVLTLCVYRYGGTLSAIENARFFLKYSIFHIPANMALKRFQICFKALLIGIGV
jgi:hypothetical protein